MTPATPIPISYEPPTSYSALIHVPDKGLAIRTEISFSARVRESPFSYGMLTVYRKLEWGVTGVTDFLTRRVSLRKNGCPRNAFSYQEGKVKKWVTPVTPHTNWTPG